MTKTTKNKLPDNVVITGRNGIGFAALGRVVVATADKSAESIVYPSHAHTRA